MESWTQLHLTRPLTTPAGETIEIDEEMIPLVQELWRLGYTTFMCCQDMGEAILGGGITHMPGGTRETHAARSQGRAMLRVAAEQAPRLLADLGPLYVQGIWLASIPVTREGPSTWAMVTFPRQQISQAVELLRNAKSRPPQMR